MLLTVLLLLIASIGHAQSPARFPPEFVNFKPLRDQPVFSGGGKGAWDEFIRERGWIVRSDSGLWEMWYTGYNPERSNIKMLGHAISLDGIKWTRHPDNPIYTKHWVEDMMVVKHGGKYWMFAEGEADVAQLLVSEDGITWQRVGPLDIRLKNGEPIKKGPYGTPTAFVEDGVWRLFYERSDRGIWLATSTDMKVWTNVQDEPVIGVGPGEYDKDQVALNQIIKHQGKYYAFYHGCARTGPNKDQWTTCVASSPDLLRWEKYAKNPLQPTEQNKSSGILVHDGERYRLYTMHPAVYVHEGR